MMWKIKKTNLTLGLLVIAFFIVTLSLVLEIQTSAPVESEPPTVTEIEEHRDILITHGGDDWPLGCSECHFEPIYGECTECHVPDYWVGEDDSTYHAHHDLSYTGFMDCKSSECHDPDPNDVRFVKTDLVVDNDWHDFCDKCHANGAHE